MNYPVTAQDRKWQEENDARTLAEATVIANDEVRLRKAKKRALEMAEEKQKEAKDLSRIDNLFKPSSATNSVPKPTNRGHLFTNNPFNRIRRGGK